MLDHFKSRQVGGISTQEINEVGGIYRKKKISHSSGFKASLAKAREKNKKCGISSRDPEVYKTLMAAVLNEPFE